VLVHWAAQYAICGVGLQALLLWIRRNSERVGEQGKRNRRPQVPDVLALLQNPVPP